jgi:hypothetical protein
VEENIEFQILSINVLDQGFPPAAKKLNITVDDVEWKYKFSFSVQNFPGDSKCISVTFTCKLHYKNPKKKISIARLETHGLFKVKGASSLEGKLQVLYKVMEISNWNVQGMFAAGTEGTEIMSLVAPAINFRVHEEGFKKELTDGWN